MQDLGAPGVKVGKGVAGNLTSLASLADSTPSVFLVPLKISEDDKHVLQVAIYINEIGIRGSSESKEF